MEKHEIEFFERTRISELYQRLSAIETSMKDERRQLWRSEKECQEDYTVCDRLEILSMDISGYVSQITSEGYTRQEPEEVIKHLHKLSIFDVECIVQWYPSAAEEYPKIKQFFELLDYIRLLTLQYVEKYNLPESRQ